MSARSQQGPGNPLGAARTKARWRSPGRTSSRRWRLP